MASQAIIPRARALSPEEAGSKYRVLSQELSGYDLPTIDGTYITTYCDMAWDENQPGVRRELVILMVKVRSTYKRMNANSSDGSANDEFNKAFDALQKFVL
jgi:hypothetical protein